MAQKEDPIGWRMKNALSSRYPPIPQSAHEKIMDNIMELAEQSRNKHKSLRMLLEQVARMIFRLFDFDEIAIGLRNPATGRYKYEVVFGYSKRAEGEFRKLEYTHDDMVSYRDFPFVKIGRVSEFDPVEGYPEKELHLCDRPFDVGEKRASDDDFKEGDYMDFWMYGSTGEMIGWIELAKPRNGKLPTCETVRWIEVFTEMCALIVERKQSQESSRK